jgi:hypothetical protein
MRRSAADLTHQGISWDEQVDQIARSYPEFGGWLRLGYRSQPGATMLHGLVYSLTGTHDLLTARWVSALVGALTL